MAVPASLPYPGSLTDVAGIEVGHFTHTQRPTGCTVVITRAGAVAGCDVRGAAPGTRETDLLSPTNLVERVHAVVLAGGSAWGLEAATGVMRWLEREGVGMTVGPGRIPIVPAAVLFDLYLGDTSIRPDAASGEAACAAASTAAPAQGCVGAGTGAVVGKIFGVERAMKGGIGTASLTVDGVTVAALVACNALGDVIDPETSRIIAGARSDDGRGFLDSRRALLGGMPPKRLVPAANTTIGIIATDAVLDKSRTTRLATVGHDGFARAINPTHTMLDGDALFALATGASGRTLDMMTMGTLAAEVVARAIVNGVRAASDVTVGGLHVPAASAIA